MLPSNPATWRYAYNPLVGMTMARLVTLLNSGEQGYYADLTWLYRYIEKRDAILRAVKVRRLSAIKSLDWEIKVKSKFTKKAKDGNSKPIDAAKRQQEFLHESYDGIGNLKAAIEFLALADFRGFAHLEKHYRNGRVEDGVFHLEPVPQWHWCRRNPNPQWFYNKNATEASFGVPIDKRHFIIRECESPIDEIAAICYLRKNMSQKDWDAFIETFGIPPLFIELPVGVGTRGNEEFQAIIEQVIGDSRGVLPNGAKVASVPDGARGGRPFDEHIRYQDEQIVIAATGGLLTALSQATGMNEGQSGNHRDAFEDIARGEAVLISEAFQEQFDKFTLAQEFPDEEVMVYFELSHQSIGEGDKVIRDAQELSAAGFEVDRSQLEEKTGYKLMSKRELDAAAQEAAVKAEQEAQAKQAEAEAAAKAEQERAAASEFAGLGLDDKAANRIRKAAEAIANATNAPDAELSASLEAAVSTVKI